MAKYYGHHDSPDVPDSYSKSNTYTKTEVNTLTVEASANATQQAKNRYDGLWDDLRFPMNTFSEAITGQEPNWQPFRGSCYAPFFEENAVQSATFAAQMPHGWKIGTDITPHVHWSVATTASGGDVVWKLEYTLAERNAIFPTTTTIAVTAAIPTNPYEHATAFFPAIDMSGISGISTMLSCRLFREGTNPNDDFDDGAAVLEVDFHYQLDELGSVTAGSKF